MLWKMELRKLLFRSSGWDVNKQSTGLAEIDDVDAFNHASPNGTAQAEVPRTGGGNLIEATSVKKLKDLQHEQMDIGLEDSGDEATHIALPQSGESRRKFRMMP